MTNAPPIYLKINLNGNVVLDSTNTNNNQGSPRILEFDTGGITQIKIDPNSLLSGHGDGYIGIHNDGTLFFSSVSGNPSGPASGDLSGTFPAPTVSTSNGSPIITTSTAVSGDLSGSMPNPTVVALQGNPVSSTKPANNNVLQWNGASWVPAINSPSGTAGGDLSGSFPNPQTGFKNLFLFMGA